MITANHVVLDLAGFALSGVAGATVGVNLPATQTNLLVRNGTIRGWSNLGIFGNCVNGQFEHLNLSDNGTAITAGPGGRAASCALSYNLNGIFVVDACTVQDCDCQSTGVGVQAG